VSAKAGIVINSDNSIALTMEYIVWVIDVLIGALKGSLVTPYVEATK
jgi:hypothetical protein